MMPETDEQMHEHDASKDAVKAEADMMARHAKEIAHIIAEHHAKAMKLEGHKQLAVRRQCSKAIADACERHRAEANAPPVEARGIDAGVHTDA